jgi:hypothetical protein
MTSRQFARYLFRFVTRYPRVLIAGILVITGLFLWQIPQLKLDPSVKAMIPRDHPIVQTMNAADSLFGGSAIVVLAVESDRLLYGETLRKFKAFEDSLAAIPLIDRVTSLYSVSRILNTADGFQIQPVLGHYPESEAAVDSLRAILLSDEYLVGNLVSADGRMLAFICHPRTSFDYDEHVLKRAIERVVAHFAGPEKIYYSGLPITRAEVIDQMRRDLRVFMPYGLLFMAVFLVLSFRSWLGVFLPFCVVVIATIWTFGLMAVLGLTLPFTGILIPVMLIAIANDYGIHIIAHYYTYTRLQPEAPRADVIKRVIRSLGVPIFLAGLTTVIGFLGLLGHVLPRAREMGLLMSFGICVAFTVSLLLIPAVLALTRPPQRLQHLRGPTLMDRGLQRWTSFFIRHRQTVLLVVLVAVMGVGTGIRWVRVDANPDHYFGPGARLRVHNEAISQVFGGATQLSILVEGDVQSPALLRALDQLSRHLRQQPLVSRTVSLVDILSRMHRVFQGNNEGSEELPATRELVSQYLFLYGLTGNETDLELFLDDVDEPHHTQLLVRLKEVQAQRIAELIDDTADYIRANFYDLGPMEITGPAALLATLYRLIVQGQIVSLLVSTVIIFLIMALAFRSLVGGLLANIPLVVAMIVVFGFMGYSQMELNIATVMISSIMVGVGIDYSVHFLWHLREHIREGQDLETALATTLKISGKGIVYNALSVMVGFSVLLLSVFLPVNFFGLLIVLSISICLFGALALLPALVSWLNPRFLYR